MRQLIAEWLFAWKLAYGGVILAIQGMQEMTEVAQEQSLNEVA